MNGKYRARSAVSTSPMSRASHAQVMPSAVPNPIATAMIPAIPARPVCTRKPSRLPTPIMTRACAK